jgi:hypothetical protein
MKLKSECNGKVVQSLSDRNPELKRGSCGVRDRDFKNGYKGNLGFRVIEIRS